MTCRAPDMIQDPGSLPFTSRHKSFSLLRMVPECWSKYHNWLAMPSYGCFLGHTMTATPGAGFPPLISRHKPLDLFFRKKQTGSLSSGFSLKKMRSNLWITKVIVSTTMCMLFLLLLYSTILMTLESCIWVQWFSAFFKTTCSARKLWF